MQDVRYLVVHKPGPAWQAGKPIFEQEGLRDHIAHFRQWLEQGKLELGGPFLDEAAGGMMVPTAGVPEEEIVAFVQADPAVHAGLLTVEVRPWLIGMKR
jgi:uncharacterized protein YciI